MAGDWIKLEVITPQKPEIFIMSEQLQIDPDAVLGKVIRLWCYFDQHLLSGNASGNAPLTVTLIDAVGRVKGFTDALLSVGWLTQTDKGLRIPNFDRHNGKTAKNRALTARRVAQHKKRSANAPLTVGALPREEKSTSTKEAPNGASSDVWSLGLELLKDTGTAEPTARKFLGSLQRDYGDVDLTEAIRASVGKTDPKSYIMGVLKNIRKKSDKPAPYI